jgi:hypothetical protein
VSASTRFISALFTALPSFGFLSIYIITGSLFGSDYWWETYLGTLVFLVILGLVFGFALPTALTNRKLHQPWMWILAQGALAWILALILLGLLNLTPLCVGRNNGDGRNDLAMCIIATFASAFVYSPVFLVAQAVSAMVGQWVLTAQNGAGKLS